MAVQNGRYGWTPVDDGQRNDNPLSEYDATTGGGWADLWGSAPTTGSGFDYEYQEPEAEEEVAEDINPIAPPKEQVTEVAPVEEAVVEEPVVTATEQVVEEPVVEPIVVPTDTERRSPFVPQVSPAEDEWYSGDQAVREEEEEVPPLDYSSFSGGGLFTPVQEVPPADYPFNPVMPMNGAQVPWEQPVQTTPVPATEGPLYVERGLPTGGRVGSPTYESEYQFLYDDYRRLGLSEYDAAAQAYADMLEEVGSPIEGSQQWARGVTAPFGTAIKRTAGEVWDAVRPTIEDGSLFEAGANVGNIVNATTNPSTALASYGLSALISGIGNGGREGTATPYQQNPDLGGQSVAEYYADPQHIAEEFAFESAQAEAGRRAGMKEDALNPLAPRNLVDRSQQAAYEAYMDSLASPDFHPEMDEALAQMEEYRQLPELRKLVATPQTSAEERRDEVLSGLFEGNPFGEGMRGTGENPQTVADIYDIAGVDSDRAYRIYDNLPDWMTDQQKMDYIRSLYQGTETSAGYYDDQNVWHPAEYGPDQGLFHFDPVGAHGDILPEDMVVPQLNEGGMGGNEAYVWAMEYDMDDAGNITYRHSPEEILTLFLDPTQTDPDMSFWRGLDDVPQEVKDRLLVDLVHGGDENYYPRTGNDHKMEYFSGSKEEYERLANEFIASMPVLQRLIDSGVMTQEDVARFFFKRYSTGKTGSSGGYGGGYRSGGGGGGYRPYYGSGKASQQKPNPSTATQKKNRVYNVMKNWSF